MNRHPSLQLLWKSSIVKLRRILPAILLLTLFFLLEQGVAHAATSQSTALTQANVLSRFKLLGPFTFTAAVGNSHGGGAGHYSNRDYSAQEIEPIIINDFASTLFYQDDTGHLQVVNYNGQRPSVSVDPLDSNGNQLVSFSYNSLTETIYFEGTITPNEDMINAYYQYAYSYGTVVDGEQITMSKTFSASFSSPLTTA